jgi:hypothetical protein
MCKRVCKLFSSSSSLLGIQQTAMMSIRRGTSFAPLLLSHYGRNKTIAEAINRDEVETLARNGAQIVEVLGAKEYDHAHIAGAINLPLTNLNRESASVLIRDRMVIVYCYDYQ